MSWGSVAIFTTGKTQRATGSSVMTSSERQVLYALASDMRVRKKKKKAEIKEKQNEKTMAYNPSLWESYDFSFWYLLLTLPGLSGSSFCLRLSGHIEIDVIALKQVSSTRVTDSGGEAPGLTG